MTSPGTKPFRRRAVSLAAKAVASAVLCQIYPVGIPKSHQARCPMRLTAVRGFR